MATREVMRQDLADGTATAIAGLAVRWVKPLVVRASAVINGTEAGERAAGEDTAARTAGTARTAR
jgi:hypothetical protein